MPGIGKWALAIAASISLLGCGGGGGDATSPVGTVRPPLEGAYEQITSSNDFLDVIVLENGDFWSASGRISGGSHIVTAFQQGAGASRSDLLQNTNIYTANDIRQFAVGATSTGSITASYVPRTAAQGTVTLGTVQSTFNVTALAPSVYNYDAAANLGALAGDWTGAALDGSTSSLTVDGTTGTFTGSNFACKITGTAVPRASGKNVFDVSLQSATSCSAATATAKGIALAYPVANGKQQLVVLLVDATRTQGTIFAASR